MSGREKQEAGRNFLEKFPVAPRFARDFTRGGKAVRLVGAAVSK